MLLKLLEGIFVFFLVCFLAFSGGKKLSLDELMKYFGTENQEEMAEPGDESCPEEHAGAEAESSEETAAESEDPPAEEPAAEPQSQPAGEPPAEPQSQPVGEPPAEPAPASYYQISQDTAKQMMAVNDGHVIVDVRRLDEYQSGHIPGAILIPNESIGTERPAELPDLNQIILVYCRSGNRSRQAAQKLFDMGYRNVYEFGGIITWTGEIVTDG